jgi:hypothetical protein
MTATRTSILCLATTAALALPATASAKDGDVETQGRCSNGVTAELKLSPDDGRIETEFEVDQNRSGVRWTVRIRRGGRLAASARATTRGPSGSFTVRRLLSDGAGADRVTVRATSSTGLTCTARATLA